MNITQLKNKMNKENYHEIESILNKFKNGETYSTSIENIQNLIKQAEESERERIVKFINSKKDEENVQDFRFSFNTRIDYLINLIITNQ